MGYYDSLGDIERNFGSVAEYNRRMEEESYEDDFDGIYEEYDDRDYCEKNGHIIDDEIIEYHCSKYDCTDYSVFTEENSQEYFCHYKECYYV